MNDNYIKVKVTGRNVNNYIKWLIKQKINIIELNIIKYNELDIITEYQNYKLLNEYSKTYKIRIIKKYGKLRLFDIIKNNIIIFLSLILSIFFLYSLSNIIFSVDILYNDKEIINILNNELEKYDIKKFRFKKSTKYLNEVKEQILKNNQDILEWIEIEENGTKYTVKIVERKKADKETEYKYQSIITTKDAIIKNIKAYSGEKTKTINQYVKAGEIVISGILTKPDGTNLYTQAKGQIYGEVWYKVNIEYPMYYQEEKVTGKSKNVISIIFLNNKIPFFPYKKYKQFKLETNTLIEDNLIPIKIIKERLYEVILKEEIYTEEEVISKAIKTAKTKLQESNNKIIEINEVMIIDKENLNSKIKLNLFISTTEDITQIKEIKPEENKTNNLQE